jgi:hypothetical protein
VAEPRELTVVNIVDPIDLSKVGAIEGEFGVPSSESTGRMSSNGERTERS